ncbi:MAG: CsgG/HfaB family protein [Pirellulaceae bacterium]
MRYLAICQAALLVFGCTVGAGAADVPSSPWRRWAVVATPELRSAGLSDLLTAKLTENDSIELVEREQLNLALRELDLAAHLGADAAGRRLQLGKLLKADALVLLSTRRNEEKTFLRLVVSDCVYGARLSEDFRLMETGQTEEAADWVVEAIGGTRSRFRGGITQMMAVPPFLSKNLTPQYDHRQAGYAALLANALSRQTGVAVVEIEEARAIDRELKLASEGLQRAVVPLFVEGEFAMERGAREGGPLVRLSVRIKDAKGVRSELARDALTTEQVVELLSDELPRRVLNLPQDESPAPLRRRQQQRLLAERGAVFSEVGAYEHSTSLREAALLLAPDEVETRIALVLDYNHWQHARGQENVALQLAVQRDRRFAGRRVDEQTWAKTHAERLARLRRTAPHVEHLIRARQVNPWEADRIVSMVVHAMAQNALYNEAEFGGQDKLALEDLFWRVYPHFPELDPTLRDGTLSAALRYGAAAGNPRTALAQYQQWTENAIGMIVERFPRCTAVGRGTQDYDDSRTLDDLFRFLTEIPGRELPIAAMSPLTMRTMNQHIASRRLPIDDVRAFYARLKASEAPFNNLYARCGLLAIGVHGAAPPEPLASEMQGLLEYVNRWNSRNPDERSVSFAYRVELERLRAEFERRTEAAAPQRSPLPVNPVPAGDASAPISFTPTGVASPWTGLERCNDSMDLLWSFGRVDVMTAAGEVRTVFDLKIKQWSIIVSDMIYSAHWDGRNIWVATMKSGIVVVSPQGEILARIDSENGLPLYRALQLHTQYRGHDGALLRFPAPLRLHPISPGKCLAIGQFGGDRRLWFAMIERGDDGGWTVDVFHTATKSYDKSAQSLADPETIFQLQWTIVVDAPEKPGRRLLLAGRGLQRPDVTWPPLAIDLDSREVSVLPTRVSEGFERFTPQLWAGGKLWAVRYKTRTQSTVGLLAAPREAAAPSWTGRELVPPSDPRRNGCYRTLFSFDGAIYNPGDHWWRFDVDRLTPTCLNDRPLAAKHQFEHYGVSAHYGFVAWNRGDQLYRVLFEPPKAQSLAERYPFVPAAQRERHHAAVEAIRRLGGQVGTQWGVAAHPEARFRPPQWRTIVYLPKEWAGGDAELARLGDLFNLCELHLVQADVGDEGLRQIAPLESLQDLSLIQTKVTNDGVAALESHPGLNFCHLESSNAGPRLGDAAVAHLSHLPKLVALNLVGRGFSDAALGHLQDRRRLRELLLQNTVITPAAIAALKKARPSLQVSDRPMR